MSRSFRKNPVFGIGSGSEKSCKRSANRRLRSVTNSILKTKYEDEDLVLPVLREVSNPWSMAKDGKCGWWDASEEDKSSKYYRQIMSK